MNRQSILQENRINLLQQKEQQKEQEIQQREYKNEQERQEEIRQEIIDNDIIKHFESLIENRELSLEPQTFIEYINSIIRFHSKWSKVIAKNKL